ncbi:restriction endonuclease subunit S [Nodularia chucula]|uniref:restriction endonuclease subunit S n=1 Tax=Nodularia chucula TaxID=3093667 RepID=UPI0039C66EDD
MLAQNVRANRLDFSNTAFMPESVKHKLVRNKLEYDDVLMTRSGANFGDTAVYKGQPDTIYACADVLIIRSEKVPGGYLSTYLNTKIGRALLTRGAYGMAQPHIAPNYLYTMTLPRFGESFENGIDQLVIKSNESKKLAKSLYAEAEALLLHELGLDNLDLSAQKSYVANFSETVESDRFDAEYFQTKYKRLVNYLSTRYLTKSLKHLGQVTKGRSVEYYDSGIPVIRSGDLNDLDNLEEIKYTDPNQQYFLLQNGDICISSIGFGSIGKIQIFNKEGKYATVSEVTVIRQKEINSYYLQIFLQSLAGQLQIERYITGATGQLHLYPRDVEKIIVPIIPQEKQRQFEVFVMRSLQAKKQAKDLLEQAKQQVEQIILGG